MSLTLHDFTLPALDGGTLNLADYAGRVLLVVNTASECGFTPQYAGLESLWRTYREKGLVVLGCPCDQFGHQEPGEAAQIRAFCTTRYDVTFPLSGKILVKGPDAHPLFRHLTQAAPGLLGSEAIKWNFTKFLCDRQGRVMRRFAPTTAPADLARDIEALLG
ncbi:MAG: glutathione peroxidase [Pseudomonadota bacterium]